LRDPARSLCHDAYLIQPFAPPFRAAVFCAGLLAGAFGHGDPAVTIR